MCRDLNSAAGHANSAVVKAAALKAVRVGSSYTHAQQLRGDPFITFAERGRGVEKFDQNANAVREVA